jgi:hypothetical protein
MKLVYRHEIKIAPRPKTSSRNRHRPKAFKNSTAILAEKPQLQHPSPQEKFQAPILTHTFLPSALELGTWNLELGIWNFSEAWRLGFGAFQVDNPRPS